MIITQTPFRMSFFGGGTDFPDYYKEHGGSVISTTFDKYCMVTVGHLPRIFDYSDQVTYSKVERVEKIEDIQHPAVRNAMKYLDMHELRIDYVADLPARTGLGTSSSFAVGLLNAFYCLEGKYADKKQLAEDAIHVERVMCDEAGGVQDQIAVAYGGLNRIDFDSEGFRVNPIIISDSRKKELNDNLMLFFTGFSRFSADIAVNQNKCINNKLTELRYMKAIVDEAYSVLTSNANLSEFGKLLDETWKVKRGLTTQISNDTIDGLYQKAIEAGATGGKLLGAGGGGFLLFYVDKDKQDNVKEALTDCVYAPFEFESGGARVLYYKSEEYDKALAKD